MIQATIDDDRSVVITGAINRQTLSLATIGWTKLISRWWHGRPSHELGNHLLNDIGISRADLVALAL